MTTPSEDYRVIPISQGQLVKVSPEDYEWLNQWKWYAHWDERGKCFYADRPIMIDGKRTLVSMHREILGLKKGDGYEGDHRNHDTLDNRRCNLRKASRTNNNCNQRMRKDNTSGFKGVSKKGSRYRASIQIANKWKQLGTRDTAEEAHQLYRDAAIRLHGDFASF